MSTQHEKLARCNCGGLGYVVGYGLYESSPLTRSRCLVCALAPIGDGKLPGWQPDAAGPRNSHQWALDTLTLTPQRE